MLRDFELVAERGDYLALMGPSGSGKTTLLSILGGLERPQSGLVVVEGCDLGTCTGDELSSFRRNTVGFVFQHFGLFDTATALENVELALSLSRCGRRRRRRKATDLLARFGLAERLTHFPVELSGGERQRVGMARALANDPRLILADEPTGNLDAGSATTVLELLEELRTVHGCTLFVATHDESSSRTPSSRPRPTSSPRRKAGATRRSSPTTGRNSISAPRT